MVGIFSESFTLIMVDERHHRLRLLLRDGFPGGQVAQAEAVLVAERLEHLAQREVEGVHRIAAGKIGKVHPVLDVARIVPEFRDAIGLNRLSVAHVAIFLDGRDGVGAIAFDEVIAKAVEADLFDQPARQLEQLGIDVRIAVREIGHVAESHLIP